MTRKAEQHSCRKMIAMRILQTKLGFSNQDNLSKEQLIQCLNMVEYANQFQFGNRCIHKYQDALRFLEQITGIF